jgi:hypothetical protein
MEPLSHAPPGKLLAFGADVYVRLGMAEPDAKLADRLNLQTPFERNGRSPMLVTPMPSAKIGRADDAADREVPVGARWKPRPSTPYGQSRYGSQRGPANVRETGRLALGGDPATLWSDERIRDAYLGGAQAKAST